MSAALLLILVELDQIIQVSGSVDVHGSRIAIVFLRVLLSPIMFVLTLLRQADGWSAGRRTDMQTSKVE